MPRSNSHRSAEERYAIARDFLSFGLHLNVERDPSTRHIKSMTLYQMESGCEVRRFGSYRDAEEYLDDLFYEEKYVGTVRRLDPGHDSLAELRGTTEALEDEVARSFLYGCGQTAGP